MSGDAGATENDARPEMPGVGRRALVGAGAALAVAVWAVLRARALPPATGTGAVAGGVAAILAWGLVAGLLASLAARAGRHGGLVSSRARVAGGAALGATVVLGLVLRRLPGGLASGVTAVLGWPWAGAVWVDIESYATGQAITAAWTVVDLVGVVVAARLTWRVLDRGAAAGGAAARADRPARVHVGVAVTAAVALAVVLASLAGTLADTGAGVGAALGFLAVNPLPAVALAVGLAGVRTRFDGRAAVVLATAWVLDTLAGLLTACGALLGPHRLQTLPVDEAFLGVVPDAAAVLSLSVLTLAVCAPLLVVGSVARAMRTFEARSPIALWLGLVANTVDAVATGVGLRSGAVEEANPLVRLGGLGPKWVIVTALFIVLHRLRPRLVWLVTVAYLLVVAYHLVGGLLLA